MLPDDPELVALGLRRLIKYHLFLIAQKDGQPVGFMCGLVSPHIFNPKRLSLQEIWWWVDIDHRRGRAGKMLLDAFVEWGKEHVDWIFLATHRDTNVKPTALAKRGFVELETEWLLEV
jgi:hypothetical protein